MTKQRNILEQIGAVLSAVKPVIEKVCPENEAEKHINMQADLEAGIEIETQTQMEEDESAEEVSEKESEEEESKEESEDSQEEDYNDLCNRARASGHQTAQYTLDKIDIQGGTDDMALLRNNDLEKVLEVKLFDKDAEVKKVQDDTDDRMLEALAALKNIQE